MSITIILNKRKGWVKIKWNIFRFYLFEVNLNKKNGSVNFTHQNTTFIAMFKEKLSIFSKRVVDYPFTTFVGGVWEFRVVSNFSKKKKVQIYSSLNYFIV